MEKQSCVNWRITMEGVVNDLKETVKIQATKLELLEETVKEQRDRLECLGANHQFPSRNCNIGIPVVRLVRLRRLPSDNQDCTSEAVVTGVRSIETRDGQENECICSDEEIELIPESLAAAEKRQVSEAEGCETFDFEEGIADQKKNNFGGAEPGRISVSRTSTQPSRTKYRTSVKNKTCATTQLSNTSERRISTMSNLGPRKKNSSGVERPKCTLCLKTFVTVDSLRRHMKTHTGEKPFRCQTCRRAFATSHNLLRHIRTHTGEKPFECNVCRKSFAQSQNLTTHARTHTGERPLKCEGCPKSFNQKSHFVRHKRVHTGEKPFTCNFCNQTFGQKINLDDHIRIHTGERPYKCVVCGADFKRSANLHAHKKTHK